MFYTINSSPLLNTPKQICLLQQDSYLLIVSFSLQQELKRWQAYVDDNAVNEWLLSTCVAAAGFLTYSGGMDPDSRIRLSEYFNVMCERHGLPMPKKKLFKDVPLIRFLYSEVNSFFCIKLLG